MAGPAQGTRGNPPPPGEILNIGTVSFAAKGPRGER